MCHLTFKMIFSHIIWMDLFLCECTSLFRYFWVKIFFFLLYYAVWHISHTLFGKIFSFLCVCKLGTAQVKACVFAEISWNATIPEWCINSLLHVFFLGTWVPRQGKYGPCFLKKRVYHVSQESPGWTVLIAS